MINRSISLAMVSLLTAGLASAQSVAIPPREENAARWVSGQLEQRGYQPIGPSLHLQRVLSALGWALAPQDTSGTPRLHERESECEGQAKPCTRWEITRSTFSWARDSSSLSLNLFLGTLTMRHDSITVAAASAGMRRDSVEVVDAYTESPEANETRRCLAWENTTPPRCRSYAPKG